jgi:O-antigen ligase
VKDKLKTQEKLIAWCLVVVTLSVTPTFSYDPINVFRFFTLAIFGFISFILVLINWRKLVNKSKLLVFISLGFITGSTISFLASDLNFPDSIFGVTGRQTGYLTYISLLSLLVVTALVSSDYLSSRIINILIGTGLISAVYGVFQSFNLDIFEWVNPYSSVFGLFGNPNFLSSFMGISATASFAILIGLEDKRLFKAFTSLYILLSIFIIFKTNSQQGYLVLFFGVLVVGIFWIKASPKFSKFTLTYLSTIFVGSVLVVLDILQKSPWTPVLYKESVALRGDFWRTGWNITKDNPFFGVGLDGYRDSFRLYRDQIATNRAPDSTISSAHNVFLDISSGGGLVLLFFYLLIILCTLVSAVKVIRRTTEFNANFAGLFGAWVAYLAQSLISINQIGLAIWGWILSGFIIGYEINTRSQVKEERNFKIGGLRVAVAVGLPIAIVVALPLVIADAEFRSTVKSGDVLKIEENLDRWPQSVIRMNIASQIFSEGGLNDRALVISKKAVDLNPYNFEAWERIYLNPVTNSKLKLEALNNMKKLDPLNSRSSD